MGLRKNSLIMAITLLLIAFSIGILLYPTTVKAEIFTSDGMTVAYDAVIPADMTNADAKGVMLKTSTEGSGIKLNEMTGKMELCFGVFSNESFGGSAFNLANFDSKHLDLVEMRIKITDLETNESFSIALRGGEKNNVITTSASIVTDSIWAGYAYVKDSGNNSNTPAQNAVGKYTLLGGTTFCNRSVALDAISSEFKPIVITFDPVSMMVSGRHYGLFANQNVDRTIANLTDEELMGHGNVQSGYNRYSAELIAHSINAGCEAQILLFSLNGQSLAGATFTDNISANVGANIIKHAEVNKRYALPAPTVYDVIDGNKNQTVKVKVMYGETPQTVYVGDTAIQDNNYALDTYFTPTKEGEYKILYSAVDVSDVEGNVTEYKIKAKNSFNTFYEIGDYSFLTGDNYAQKTDVGKGGSVSLTKGECITDQSIYPVKTSVKVVKGGNKIAEFDAAKANEVTFAEAGEYTITYFNNINDEVYDVNFSVIENAPIFETANIRKAYNIGYELNIPQLSALYNGKTLRTATIVLDNIGGFKTGKKVVLDKKGNYSLKYLVTAGGVTYQSVYDFAVTDLSSDMFISEKSMTTEGNADSPAYMSKFNGIKLTGSGEGARARYSKVVDLSDNTKDDTLISFAIAPSEMGVEDYQQMTVTLTDVYDESNAVKIQIYRGSWSQNVAFVKAAATNQLLTGLDKGVPKTEQRFGMGINHSFRAFNFNGCDIATFSFDYSERAVYVQNPASMAYSNMVIDFDNPKHFSPSTLWKGFTTGEVYLSVAIEKVLSAPASLYVTNIDGTSLSGDEIINTDKPNIKIESLGYALNSAPEAKVGKPYTVFGATAFDALDGKIDNVAVKVYSDYGLVSQKEQSVVNGVFTPKTASVYTVEYSVYDSSKNKATRTYAVTAKQSLDAMEITAEFVGGDITVGESYPLGSITVSGGSGKPKISYTLKKGEEDIKVIGNVIKVISAGDYTLKISAEDYLGQTVTKDISLSALVSDKPIYEKVVMPKVLIKNKLNPLPELFAYDYNDGGKRTSYTITVTDVAGARVLAGNNYLPVINGANGTAKITYESTSKAGGKISLSYDVEVIETFGEDGVLSMKNYFRADSGSLEEKDNCVIFTANTDSTLSFLRPVKGNADFSFAFVKDMGLLGSLEIDLCDATNLSNKLTIKLQPQGDKTQISVMNNEPFISENKFSGDGSRFGILYHRTLNSVLNKSNSKTIAALDGLFEAFKGDVYVDFRFIGVTGQMQFALYEIFGQPLSNIGIDPIGPKPESFEELPVSVELNSKVIVPLVKAWDCLDPEVSVFVKVEGTSGVIISERQMTAPLEFTANAEGGYAVIYTLKDSSGCESVYRYAIYVYDDVKPEFTIDGEVTASGVVGKAILLPSAITNESGVSIKLYVTNTDGVIRQVEGNTFTPDKKGKYLVSFVACDIGGNITIKDFVIVVKG